MQCYDIAVIGAGIAGCMAAREAKVRGKSVAIIDRAPTVATGGSGAAGAFISPKLGHKTDLLDLTNLAFEYAVKHYRQNFSKYFTQSGVIRIPKDPDDIKNFPLYQSLTSTQSQVLDANRLRSYGIKGEQSALFFNDGGVCDAKGLCEALIEDIDFLSINVTKIVPKQNFVTIQERINAKSVILATGYEAFKTKLDYMGIKGLWGSRGDFYTDTIVKASMHKKISISATTDGVVKLGATHVKHKAPCMLCDGAPLNSLVQMSKAMVDLKNLQLKETFCGMRSGSHDFKPLVGRVIDAAFMLQNYPKITRGYKRAPIKYIDNIYVLNGLGGRGFVLAPLMAKWLIDSICDGTAIDERVNPDRLFLKWARRLNNKPCTKENRC